MPDVQFEDSRLTALYDEMCAGRDDLDYYLALTADLGAPRVLDVGCGTGVLAVDLATAGHRVTGVDPAAAMLAVARTRAGGEMVTWLPGDASVATTGGFDLALMTGHVAQVFTDEFSWRTTLTEGFEVESLHSDCDRSPVLLGVGPASPEQIYVARRT